LLCFQISSVCVLPLMSEIMFHTRTKVQSKFSNTLNSCSSPMTRIQVQNMYVTILYI
jgi:hypothetical protein